MLRKARAGTARKPADRAAAGSSPGKPARRRSAAEPAAGPKASGLALRSVRGAKADPTAAATAGSKTASPRPGTKQPKRKTAAKPRWSPRAVEVNHAVATLAHDLRTGLTSVLALAELTAAEPLPAHITERMATIQSVVAQLVATASLALDAAKAGTTEIVPARRTFAPAALAHGVADALAARVSRRRLEIKVDLAPDLPERLVGDDVRLRNILDALAENAAKFTVRGEIRIVMRCVSDGAGKVRLTVEVRDTGMGFPAKMRDKIFQPFAPNIAMASRQLAGAGLGLAHARAVARALGGDLTAESQPGKGSTFRVTLGCEIAPPSSDT